MCTDAVCQLPPITQKGKNTFGCLVDGKPWTANTNDGLIFSLNPIYPSFSTVNGGPFFRLRTHRRHKVEGIDSDISLYIANAVTTGNYPLNNNDVLGFPSTSARSSVGVFKVSDNFSYPFQTDSTHTGQVTIARFDVSSRIYSGTFCFTAENINGGTLVYITNGRFDIKLP